MALRQLTEEECRELVRSTSVGRVGVHLRALPVIVPVLHELRGDSIFFRAITDDARVALASDRAIVAFQTDTFDDRCRTGRSVLVVGLAGQVSGSDLGHVLEGDELGILSSTDRGHPIIRMAAVGLSGHELAP